MISLIHPSRGRAKKAHQTFLNWMDKGPLGNNVEHISSFDTDDPELPLYKSWSCEDRFHVISNNRSVVDATNKAAAKATGDIFIYLSDDFDCPKDWIQLITEEFKKYSGPTLIKVDDCLQQFHIPVLTIPIMNRDLYERLGYFWHPDYKSMFCDVDLYYTVQKLGALKFAPHLKFPHNHVSIGKAENDETYRRSAANWNQGQEVFNRRKAAGFPV